MHLHWLACMVIVINIVSSLSSPSCLVRKEGNRKVIRLDKILQLIAQKQRLYLKGTTDFINVTEKTKFPKEVILISMDVKG